MMRKFCILLLSALVIAPALDGSAHGQVHTEPDPATEPDRIRGEITKVGPSSIVVQTGNGSPVRLKLEDYSSVLRLSRASFTDVDFGVYVGSISRRLDKYSPIVRDSMSWLHLGYELRIFDETLRGMALGHRKWDLTSESVMTHGWVDDLEIRVLSIKYGPTEEEETDVDIPRDVPILSLSVGDRSLIKPGAHVFAGGQKAPDGDYEAVFIMVGDDGIVPTM